MVTCCLLPLRATVVLEWLVILVSCKIKGINELEARESEKFIGLIMLIIIQEVNIKISSVPQWTSGQLLFSN